jgi:hypothetical protein
LLCQDELFGANAIFLSPNHPFNNSPRYRKSRREPPDSCRPSPSDRFSNAPTAIFEPIDFSEPQRHWKRRAFDGRFRPLAWKALGGHNCIAKNHHACFLAIKFSTSRALISLLFRLRFDPFRQLAARASSYRDIRLITLPVIHRSLLRAKFRISISP